MKDSSFFSQKLRRAKKKYFEAPEGEEREQEMRQSCIYAFERSLPLPQGLLHDLYEEIVPEGESPFDREEELLDALAFLSYDEKPVSELSEERKTLLLHLIDSYDDEIPLPTLVPLMQKLVSEGQI